MRILVLCTGNSARSQMAEGFLRSFDPQLEVFSAGTSPSSAVNPFAIRVMKEAGVDITGNVTKSVDRFMHQSFDFVITVCDNARETCPVFTGRVRHRLHIDFPDPAEVRGTDTQIEQAFRSVRDDIRDAFHALYTRTLTEK